MCMLKIGGQFLRAYVERYNDPPVHNLITFGSQHMGVSDIPPCRKYDFVCQMARNAVKGAVYSKWAQENIIAVSPFSSSSDNWFQCIRIIRHSTIGTQQIWTPT